MSLRFEADRVTLGKYKDRVKRHEVFDLDYIPEFLAALMISTCACCQGCVVCENREVRCCRLSDIHCKGRKLYDLRCEEY